MKRPITGAAATVSRRPRIADVRVTPIAFRDPPLLNVVGVHEPWALRSIIEIETDDGRIGLGESYGDLETLGNLAKAKPLLIGLDPFDLNGLTAKVHEAVTGQRFAGQNFPSAGDKALASAIGAFEVAFLDLQGQIADRPLHEILGGAVRERVSYSAYLFYKFKQHKDDPGYPPDDWGEALTHAQMVDQTRRMVEEIDLESCHAPRGPPLKYRKRKGAPCPIRTGDLRLRRPSLYPAELGAQRQIERIGTPAPHHRPVS